jgi:hypothetical protein
MMLADRRGWLHFAVNGFFAATFSRVKRYT